MKKLIFVTTVVLLLAAFGVSAFMVGSYLMDGREQKELNAELSQIVSAAQTEPAQTTVQTEATQPTEATTVPTETTEAGMLPGYKEIYEMNPDTIGWIKMSGTQLDYPVMQTPNSTDYYLYRDFNKADSARGSIYAREVCDVFEPSDNITIYGHNMKDGSMFAALNAYTNKTTWENNSLIFFDTIYEYHTYKIFAVFATSANVGEGFSYHKFVDAANEEEFNNFVKTCKELSFYDTGITPVYGDKMICLSTCTYALNGRAHDNARLVVAAVRIT